MLGLAVYRSTFPREYTALASAPDSDRAVLFVVNQGVKLGCASILIRRVNNNPMFHFCPISGQSCRQETTTVARLRNGVTERLPHLSLSASPPLLFITLL